jgi:hypothetical protein
MNTEYIKELLRQKLINWENEYLHDNYKKDIPNEHLSNHGKLIVLSHIAAFIRDLVAIRETILNAPSPTIDEEKLVSGLTVEELEGLKQENEHLKFVVEQLEFEKQLSPKADEEKLSGVRDWKKLREEYFNDCVVKDSVDRNKIRIDYAPHDLFEWFKRKLSESPAEKEEDLESSSTGDFVAFIENIKPTK